ncbi:hypothetical protein [Ligilactobacillus pobuzihii]|nr:hypothetical protein [Ligilactobacillus pobuzihii]
MELVFLYYKKSFKTRLMESETKDVLKPVCNDDPYFGSKQGEEPE